MLVKAWNRPDCGLMEGVGEGVGNVMRKSHHMRPAPLSTCPSMPTPPYETLASMDCPALTGALQIQSVADSHEGATALDEGWCGARRGALIIHEWRTKS